MELLLAATPFVAALGLVAYAVASMRGSARWEREGWHELDRLCTELVGQLDQTAVMRMALADSLVLLRCELVMVVLHSRTTQPGLVASVAAADDGRVSVRSLPPGHDVPAPVPGSVVVPLLARPDQTGEVRVVGGPRAGRLARLRLVRGFAHTVASSLCSERMFDQQRRMIEATYERTLHDELTGLGNRAMLHEQGDRVLRRLEAQGGLMGVFLLDLDNFKQINDTLGHAAGDRVLVEVAHRLKSVLGDSDLAVRLGGDEFAVLTALRCRDDARILMERLTGSFVVPVVIEDVHLQMFASIGVALQGVDGHTVEDLLEAADAAMYAAKAGAGSRLAVPRADALRRDGRLARLAEDLSGGLPEDQILVHYQPQVEATVGQVTGFEALVRWQHPEFGVLKPGEFLSIVKRCGLMTRLTLLVLDRAVGDLAHLRETAPGVTVSVNISRRNLLSQGLVPDVASVLRRHQVEPSALVVELTELAPGPSVALTAAVQGLEDLGCQVSIHDFGSGQASVTALSQYPAIREIKIHPSIVRRVSTDPAFERLVLAIVHAAHSLGVRVVGEGVETVSVADRLRRMGCDRLQGYLFHDPATVEELSPWVSEQNRRGHAATGEGRTQASLAARPSSPACP